jgi:hypothetical protein
MAPIEHGLLVGLLALPWLWPFTTGPLPNLLPLLASWACMLLAVPLVVAQRDPVAVLRSAAPQAWLFAALVSAALGLCQWFGVAPGGPLVSPAGLGEAYGNLRQRNQFASLLSLGFAVLIWRVKPRMQWTAAVAVVLLATANAATASRTGLLQWLVLSVLACAWPGQRLHRLFVCVCALAAYALATWALPMLLLEWRDAEAANVLARAMVDLGCSSRRVLWGNVVALIAERPWTGWGAGELDYAHYVTLYGGDRFCDVLDNAHNLPLHIAVEFGIPAAGLAMVTTVAAASRARPWREIDRTRQLAWSVLVVVGLHSLLEYPLWYGPFQLAVLLAVGILAAPQSSPGARGKLAITVSCFLLVVALAWVWHQYDLVSDAYRAPSERRAWTRPDPVAALRGARLFRDQLRFAELSLVSVNKANAGDVKSLASDMLHFSPEPMVIGKLLDSLVVLGLHDQVLFYALRFRAAFPAQYREWLVKSGWNPSPVAAPS